MSDSLPPGVFALASTPLHLGLGATAVVQPMMTDMSWYEAYGERHGDDGAEGRLVAMHTFSESWDSWEVHPKGHEVVLCVSGKITLTQELPDGSVVQTTITNGQGVINEPGVWHTADIDPADGPATALFITAGLGTDHRPRD